MSEGKAGDHRVLTRQLKNSSGLDKFIDLCIEPGRRHLFGHSSILLYCLGHLGHSLTNLRNAQALFDAGRTDLAHDVSDAANTGNRLLHGLAGLVDQLAAMLNLLDACIDQTLDLFGSLCAATCQAANFTGKDGKATA